MDGHSEQDRCQLKCDKKLGHYTVSDWILAISRAKLVSQQLQHRMTPWYILAYCSRKYLPSNVGFPYEASKLIVQFMNCGYQTNHIAMRIWKWNRYHSAFKIENKLSSLARAAGNGFFYFLRNESVSSRRHEGTMTDHTIFTIGGPSSTKHSDRSPSPWRESKETECPKGEDALILSDPIDLQCDFGQNTFREETTIIYHALPPVLDYGERPNYIELIDRSEPDNIELPSVCYRHHRLFVVGGCIPSTGLNDKSFSKWIYSLDFKSPQWEWLRIESATLPQARCGSSVMFVEDQKMMVVGGWNNTEDTTKSVSLLCFNENLDEFEEMSLQSTQRPHWFGGICQGVGYKQHTVCMASQRHLECYDAHKDSWIGYQWKTTVNHYRPQLWTDRKDRNVLYIAGNGTDRIEWIDVRMGAKWKYFKYSHCLSDEKHPEHSSSRHCNYDRPSIVLL